MRNNQAIRTQTKGDETKQAINRCVCDISRHDAHYRMHPNHRSPVVEWEGSGSHARCHALLGTRHMGSQRTGPLRVQWVQRCAGSGGQLPQHCGCITLCRTSTTGYGDPCLVFLLHACDTTTHHNTPQHTTPHLEHDSGSLLVPGGWIDVHQHKGHVASPLGRIAKVKLPVEPVGRWVVIQTGRWCIETGAWMPYYTAPRIMLHPTSHTVHQPPPPHRLAPARWILPH